MPLDGLLVPLVTPFSTTGAVDHDALGRLAVDALGSGADGLVVLGTTAEAAVLDDGERRAVLRTCLGAAGGAPVVVGAGGNDTRRSVLELRGLAQWPEIHAALVAVPPFTRPSAAGVVAHFAALATAGVPLVVYNVPARTGRELGEDTIRELAAIPGVIGMKHAVPAVDATTVALLADPPPGFTVLAGDDVVAAPLLALGAQGAILASAHVATARFAAMVAAWRRGDATTGRELAAPLAGLAAALFAEPNPSVIKGVLHAMGRIPTPDVRLPLLPAAAATVTRALQAVENDVAMIQKAL
ncbi:dihydrodipicolinate synthase family protein [Pseudonocardia sp. GCM10023141]|uniref:dihydrodipicolinate synthase family protein n=1 Tax=Pseudonocardia sp. GCM10023141 TaxID=3252653 RepID=UPI00360F6389